MTIGSVLEGGGALVELGWEVASQFLQVEQVKVKKNECTSCLIDALLCNK